MLNCILSLSSKNLHNDGLSPCGAASLLLSFSTFLIGVHWKFPLRWMVNNGKGKPIFWKEKNKYLFPVAYDCAYANKLFSQTSAPPLWIKWNTCTCMNPPFIAIWFRATEGRENRFYFFTAPFSSDAIVWLSKNALIFSFNFPSAVWMKWQKKRWEIWSQFKRREEKCGYP